MTSPLSFLYFIIALIVVVTIHEFSHALVATKLGDPTAKMRGRLTLNPLAHFDPIGTLMMLIAHIGWGKPVPVDPHYFKEPKRDSALTALAGPGSNLLLALVLAIPMKYFGGAMPDFLFTLLDTIIDVSIYLFAFNMLPFPPLDGSKIIGLLVPKRFQKQYDKFLEQGVIFFIVFVIFDQYVLRDLSLFGIHISFLDWFLGTVYTFVKTALFLGL